MNPGWENMSRFDEPYGIFILQHMAPDEVRLECLMSDEFDVFDSFAEVGDMLIIRHGFVLLGEPNQDGEGSLDFFLVKKSDDWLPVTTVVAEGDESSHILGLSLVGKFTFFADASLELCEMRLIE